MGQPKHVKELCAEIERLGGVVKNVILSKHAKIYYDAKGQSRMYVTPLTPSCWRGPKNALSDIRRAFRADR